MNISFEDKNKMNNDSPFWDKLSDTDKEEYNILKQILTSSACKNRRNRSAETFQDTIDTINAYVMRNDGNDLYRGIACGLYWINDNVVINTRQLRSLLNKCKSSINGSMQMIGYTTPNALKDSSTLLVNVFPFWKDNFKELRQWTIRRQTTRVVQSPKLILNEFVTKTASLNVCEKGSKLSSITKSSLSGPNYVTPPPTLSSQINTDISQFQDSFTNEYDFPITSEIGGSFLMKNDSFSLWYDQFENDL